MLCHSILKHASGPVQFTPINKANLPEFTRPFEGSTEFSFSRFLTPYLAGYTGQAIFMDCDMIVTSDIYRVLYYNSLDKDVSVVKHDYTPKSGNKFLGAKQEAYPRKNWSSFMVFNCYTSPCKRLTPEVVNKESGKYLHRFEWCDDNRIGELPLSYNFLVGEYEKLEYLPDVLHYTLGTPCFNDYKHCDYSEIWFNYFEDLKTGLG